MAYKANVQALCDQLGIKNPIVEDDLTHAYFIFHTAGIEFRVDATDMNRAGRLFLQNQLAMRHKKQVLILNPIVKEEALAFFTDELWEDCGPDKRTLVHGIKTFRSVVAYPKQSLS